MIGVRPILCRLSEGGTFWCPVEGIQSACPDPWMTMARFRSSRRLLYPPPARGRGAGTAWPSQPRDNGHMAERLEVQRAVAASAGEIFAVLSDPRGHVAIDSSGMRGSRSKRTRSATAYSVPPGVLASSLTRTVGACSSLSVTRRSV